jgi:hypothetical protein
MALVALLFLQEGLDVIESIRDSSTDLAVVLMDFKGGKHTFFVKAPVYPCDVAETRRSSATHCCALIVEKFQTTLLHPLPVLLMKSDCDKRGTNRFFVVRAESLDRNILFNRLNLLELIH